MRVKIGPPFVALFLLDQDPTDLLHILFTLIHEVGIGSLLQ